VCGEANLIPIAHGVRIREGNGLMNLISKISAPDKQAPETWVPDVPAEQKAFDQAHKHLCKLRWIGQDVDSEYVFTVLRAAGLVSQPRAEPRPRSVPALQVQDLQAQNPQAQHLIM
jgi:hypothetical protein